MIEELVPNGPISVKEYNQKYYKDCMHASCFLGTLEHAMQKTGAYEEAMRQLSCIGWPECKETLVKAVEVYKRVLKGKIETGPHGSEFRQVVLCKNCKYCRETIGEHGKGLFCSFWNKRDWQPVEKDGHCYRGECRDN